MATNGEALIGAEIVPTGNHGLAQSDALAGEVSRSAELAVSPLEAQARAMVQARFFIAAQPAMRRSWDNVEQRLRKECARPGFAWSAWWILPVGGDSKKFPKGLSIRFAEAALRIAGNIDIQQQTIFDDNWKRVVRITALDLETNFAYSAEVAIDKTVERKDARDRAILSYRQNSTGAVVYLVAATEQELALKQGSAVSKTIRTLGLRLIPGDILDECKALIEATRAKGAQAEDPEAARKSILDNFADIGVMPADLSRFIGHDTNIFQPAERDLLRGIFVAIKNGNATWAEVLAEKPAADEKEKGAEPPPATSKLREKLAKKDTPKSEAKVDTPQATNAGEIWAEVVIAYGNEQSAHRALNAAGYESWAQVSASDKSKLAMDLIQEAKR